MLPFRCRLAALSRAHSLCCRTAAVLPPGLPTLPALPAQLIAAAAAALWAASLAFRHDAVWRHDLHLAPPIHLHAPRVPGDDSISSLIHAHFVSFNKYIYMSSVSHCLTALPRACKAGACKREGMVTCV